MKKSTIILIFLTGLTLSLNAQWQSLNFPAGNTITGLASQVDNFYIPYVEVYVSTYGNGVLVWENTPPWFTINNGLSNLNIFSLTTSESGHSAGTDGTGVFQEPFGLFGWYTSNNGISEYIVGSVAADQHDTIIAGTSGGGVCILTGWLGTWSRITDLLWIKSVYKYGKYIYYSDFSNELFISPDNGTTWNKIDAVHNVTALAMIGDTLFEGTDNGLFRSPDYGSTWSEVSLFSGSPIQCLSVYGTTIFAGINGGIYSSRNFGDDWRNISDNITGLNIGFISINDSTIYVEASNDIWGRLKTDVINGSSEHHADNNVAIYPNPATEIITVRSNLKKPGIVNIYDDLGRLIKTEPLSQNKQQIKVGDLT